MSITERHDVSMWRIYSYTTTVPIERLSREVKLQYLHFGTGVVWNKSVAPAGQGQAHVLHTYLVADPIHGRRAGQRAVFDLNRKATFAWNIARLRPYHQGWVNPEVDPEDCVRICERLAGARLSGRRGICRIKGGGARTIRDLKPVFLAGERAPAEQIQIAGDEEYYDVIEYDEIDSCFEPEEDTYVCWEYEQDDEGHEWIPVAINGEPIKLEAPSQSRAEAQWLTAFITSAIRSGQSLDEYLDSLEYARVHFASMGEPDFVHTAAAARREWKRLQSIVSVAERPTFHYEEPPIEYRRWVLTDIIAHIQEDRLESSG